MLHPCTFQLNIVNVWAEFTLLYYLCNNLGLLFNESEITDDSRLLKPILLIKPLYNNLKTNRL